MNPTAEDREFIEGHKVYFDQADLNFLHGMQPHVMLKFEMVYKAYLDPKFVLTTWCSACVVDMMQRLAHWYRNLQPLPHPEPSTGDDVVEESFRGVIVIPISKDERFEGTNEEFDIFFNNFILENEIGEDILLKEIYVTKNDSGERKPILDVINEISERNPDKKKIDILFDVLEGIDPEKKKEKRKRGRPRKG
jgi:hypothetical protein